MARKFIYGFLGFLGGVSIGLTIFAKYAATSSLSDFIFFLLPLTFGIPSMFLCIKFAKHKNIKQEQYIKAKSESIKGYLFISGSILGIQVLFYFILFIVDFIILWSLNITLETFFLFLKQNGILIYISTIPLTIFLSWLGVAYIVQKKYLKQFHSSLKISLIIVIFYIIFSIQQIFQNSSFLFIIDYFVTFASLFYFLKKAHKNLVMDGTHF